MARSQNTVVHSWVSPEFAREIKDLAERDGRSVSNLIRLVLRERLEASPDHGEGTATGGRNQEPGRATSPPAVAQREER